MRPKDKNRAFQETIILKGEELLAKVRKIIEEGNHREIIIRKKRGQTIFVIPLTAGVIGTVCAPVLAGVGAAAALLSECSITVVKK